MGESGVEKPMVDVAPVREEQDRGPPDERRHASRHQVLPAREPPGPPQEGERGIEDRKPEHQDRDEEDREAPIVSISLGLPARFLFGGPRRGDRIQRMPLWHGDVVVWGGPARFVYHGVAPLADGEHPLSGRCRINITFRVARLRAAP